MCNVKSLVIGLVLLAIFAIGCQNIVEPVPSGSTHDRDLGAQINANCPVAPTPPPSPLVTVQIGDKSVEFWPFTGNNFTGQPQDPINLIFFGQADPLDIRAALLALDGHRNLPGVPPVPPFISTWDDAIGDVQTGYGTIGGWTGSCVQLACGPYEGMRIHLRLFKVGCWTVANAHVDLQIPGTTDHQVISWEMAEQFVAADFMRTGLLDPDMPIIPTEQINPSPFRTIPAVIYNGMPVELRMMIDGPLGNVTEDVPIKTDGHALILNLAGKSARVFETRVQDFVINFDQVIPKPFCPTTDYVYVNGPVHMFQTSTLLADGTYDVNFRADGQLMVVTVNPVTGEPVSAPLTGQVKETHSGKIAGKYCAASYMKFQQLGELSQPGSGQYLTRMMVRSNGLNGFSEMVRCGQESPLQAAQ